MRTLAILSRKGGTGKTTLALHLAVAARAAGLSALIADLDRQHSAMEWARVRGPVGPAVEPVKPGALFTRQQDAQRQGFDLLVVDTGPNIEGDVEQATRCADLCLVVTRPNFFDVRAVADTAALVERIGRQGVFVLNQAPPRRNGAEASLVVEAAEGLQGLGLPLAPIGLRARAAYQQGVAVGLTAQEIDPTCLAAREVTALWRWVAAGLWPMPGLERLPEPAEDVRPVCSA